MATGAIYTVLILSLPGALGASPENTASGVDDAEVTLHCAYGNTEGRTWSKGNIKLATNDDLEDGIELTKYEVTTIETDYILKVKSIVIGDGDKYACSANDSTKSARLVAIAKPICQLSNEGTDQIKFTCSGEYGGDWPPLATMKDNADAEIGSGPGGLQADSNTTREEDITVDNDGHVFKCEMGLHDYNRPDQFDNNVAENNPGTDDDKYKCTVTAVKPTGVIITSGDEESELVKDDTLTCAASNVGVPTATYQWSDPDGGDHGSEETYTVTEAMAGKIVTCSVSNNIGSSSATFPETPETSSEAPVNTAMPTEGPEDTATPPEVPVNTAIPTEATEGTATSTEATEDTATSTEEPEDTTQESSGRTTRAVVGELGLTILVVLLCY